MRNATAGLACSPTPPEISDHPERATLFWPIKMHVFPVPITLIQALSSSLRHSFMKSEGTGQAILGLVLDGWTLALHPLN